MKTSGSIKMLAFDEKVSFISELLNQQESSLFDSKGNLNLINNKLNRAFYLAKQLQKSQVILDLKQGNTLTDALNSGTVISAVIDCRDISKLINESPSDTVKWQIMSLPAFETGGKSTASAEAKSLAVVNKTEKNNKTAEFMNFIMTNSDVGIYQLKTAGYINANTEFYYDSYLSLGVTSFNNEKVWRYMADSGMDSEPVRYGKDYENISVKITEAIKNCIYGNGDWIKSMNEITNSSK